MAGIFIPYSGGQGALWTNAKRKAALDRQRRPSSMVGKAGALFHFHAKDTKVDPWNTAVNGVLDTTHYGRELERSWIFRSVGYGHGEDYWKAIISELRLAGYDYAISIEHEDSLMSGREGLLKAIQCLKNVLIYEDRGEMFWA